MKRGHLSDYFEGVAVKVLSAVETDPARSNQHEFGTTEKMRRFLGARQHKFEASYIWLSGEQESLPDYGSATMYDARLKQAHRKPEWRIYYDTNAVTALMREGDTLFVAKRSDNHLIFIVVPQGSEILSQLLWLFGFEHQPGLSFIATEFEGSDGGSLDFAARLILDEIGVEFEDPNANSLDTIIGQFGTTLPTTAIFSKLARDTLPEVDAVASPDLALMAWLDHEEAMFRRLERNVVRERIEQGFMVGSDVDVDGFLSFSLTVQNRRKSRMGWSFEHHLAALFDCHGLKCAHPGRTERGNKPDFIFPGQAAYADPAFPVGGLTMLAAKSVCKERWRQVLPEADRITAKHLVTIEPGISPAQTDQMRAHDLQLIVPQALHSSYQPVQRQWLWQVADFIALAAERQAVGI